MKGKNNFVRWKIINDIYEDLYRKLIYDLVLEFLCVDMKIPASDI